MSYMGEGPGGYMPQEKSFASRAWDTKKDSGETHPKRWGGTSYTNKVEGYANPVRKPTITDTQVRDRPFSAYNPNSNTDTFVTKNETVVQSVTVPHLTLYGNLSPTIGLSTTHVTPSNYQNPQVDGFITKIQTEASRPSRTGLGSSTYWRQPPNSSTYGGASGYNTYSKTGSNGYSGTNGRNNTTNSNGEPLLISSGGWVRPNHVDWTSNEGVLSKPTSNIGTVINYLTTTTTPVPTMPQVESYSTTIDNTEAERRYGGVFPASSQASKTTETTYISTIDSREALRRYNGQQVDTMIIQAIGLLDDLDKELNTYAMRVREWYGWHFPELAKIVQDNIQYARAVKLMSNRTNAANLDFSEILSEDVEADLKEASVISMGTEVSELDLTNIKELCDQVLSLSEYRVQLYDYLKNRMNTIAPNLTAMVGELVGARLIAHGGSLLNLAKQPGSTVQILGAEKALFRALKTSMLHPSMGLSTMLL
ncbi:hypothetical protein GIB67_034511 [Kingdonia uniflora]|uniref:Nop domain-containing protein n=1 Tax=Kingdonia uniflora TaxID=39325 RepID=A0A7J7PB44_9MAGN|nr:hypothetical protein GIB67_034511 [Kingdonia uniflora]